MVAAWFLEHSASDAQTILDAAGVPVCPIYSIADIFADPHFAARHDIIAPEDPEIGPVPMPAVLPRFSRTPGRVQFTGPRLGEHNAEIYGRLLGLGEGAQGVALVIQTAERLGNGRHEAGAERGQRLGERPGQQLLVRLLRQLRLAQLD